MEESFKNFIIVILTFVLLYLICNKLTKSNMMDATIKPTYPYPTKPAVDQMNIVAPVVNQMNTGSPVVQQMNTIDPMLKQINGIVNNHDITMPVDTYKDACMNKELLAINSNGLSNNNIVSNMSDHELIHIDDSKPFITNEEMPITNIPELNASKLQYYNFNYTKEFDEENFDYYDPIGLYKGI